MIVHKYDADAKALHIRLPSAGEPLPDRSLLLAYADLIPDRDGNLARIDVPLNRPGQPWPVKLVLRLIDDVARDGFRASDEDKAAIGEQFPDRATSAYMTFGDPIPEGAVCENCGEHEAASFWTSGGGMGALHGDFAVWCDCCILREQVKHAEEAAARLEDLQAKLSDACTD